MNGLQFMQLQPLDTYLDIVKFLVPLAVNPNSRNGVIRAPIHTARDNGHHEIVNILEPFDYDF